MKKLPLYIAIGFFLMLSACKKQETFPIIPQISFKELTKNYNTQGTLTSIDLKFDFTDGDGDIGLKQNDVSPPYALNSPYYYDLMVDYLEFDKKTGLFVHIYPSSPIEGDTAHVQYNARLPYLVPAGKNKTLKGEITQNINTFGFGEKVRLDFFIYDRALHKSNVISTPMIETK